LAALTAAAGVQRLYLPGDVGPESQAGTEAGADVSFGTRLSLHATRFDQRVTGLVQPVLSLGTPVAGAAGCGQPVTRRVVLGNLGEIANRGWELAADGRAGPLSLGGTLSLVDSRVARTGPAALTGGALRAGDRQLGRDEVAAGECPGGAVPDDQQLPLGQHGHAGECLFELVVEALGPRRWLLAGQRDDPPGRRADGDDADHDILP
jgi:hypothetical protein